MATDQIREHVARAHEAIVDFRRDGISADGMLMKPVFQAAALKGRTRRVVESNRNH
jgi:hypothetical protein